MTIRKWQLCNVSPLAGACCEEATETKEDHVSAVFTYSHRHPSQRHIMWPLTSRVHSDNLSPSGSAHLRSKLHPCTQVHGHVTQLGAVPMSSDLISERKLQCPCSHTANVNPRWYDTVLGLHSWMITRYPADDQDLPRPPSCVTALRLSSWAVGGWVVGS